MCDERLGYVLTCPSNIGTGLRASVHVVLPLLSRQEKFDEILQALRLEKRGTGNRNYGALVYFPTFLLLWAPGMLVC